MSKIKEYDIIIIGSGQGGGPLAGAMAQQGWKTVLIEREHVGGTCINEGCTPTKTMIASARVAYMTRRSLDYGIKTGTININMNTIRQRKRDIVDSFRSGSESRIENMKNLELIKGEARFNGPKSVHIQLKNGGEEDITADTIIINVGTRPSIPDVKNIGRIPFLT